LQIDPAPEVFEPPAFTNRFPSAKLRRQVEEGSREYARQLSEYVQLSVHGHDYRAPDGTEDEALPVLNAESAEQAIVRTVLALIHLFAANFPVQDAPLPLRLTNNRRFTLPVRDFFRSRLVVENEDKFLSELADELVSVADAKIMHSGRGVLTIFRGELAIQVQKPRPLDPRSKLETPEGWEPAGPPTRRRQKE
jgi:hypothetical protein